MHGEAPRCIPCALLSGTQLKSLPEQDTLSSGCDRFFSEIEDLGFPPIDISLDGSSPAPGEKDQDYCLILIDPPPIIIFESLLSTWPSRTSGLVCSVLFPACK